MSLAAASALAQGTINFSNYNPGAGIDAPVFHADGTTKVSGPNYMAGLYAGPTPQSLSLWATTAFLSGGAAGYFNGGGVSIPTVAGGAVAYCELVYWDSTLGGTTTGATDVQAFAYMQSGLGHADIWGATPYDYVRGIEMPFGVVTGDPSVTPPGTPAPLVGLQPFTFDWIPEPTPLALLALGALLRTARSVGSVRVSKRRSVGAEH